MSSPWPGHCSLFQAFGIVGSTCELKRGAQRAIPNAWNRLGHCAVEQYTKISQSSLPRSKWVPANCQGNLTINAGVYLRWISIPFGCVHEIPSDCHHHRTCVGPDLTSGEEIPMTPTLGYKQFSPLEIFLRSYTQTAHNLHKH